MADEESPTEMRDRVRAMAAGSATWDLSDADLEALRWVLTELGVLTLERDAAREALREVLEEYEDALSQLDADASWYRAKHALTAEELSEIRRRGGIDG